MDEIKKVIDGVMGALADPASQKKMLLLEKWPAIVGSNLAGHTKPAFGKKGELTVWVDQSALAFELSQRYQQALLTRVQAALEDVEIKSLRFFVGQIR